MNNISSPPSVPRLLNDQLKLLNNKAPSNPSSLAPTKFPPQSSQNSSTSLQPNNSKADIDYDYEEDKEDDDSEDVSNFEDNDSSDNDLTNKTTVNSTASYATNPRPQNVSKLTLPAILLSTTPMPKLSYPSSSASSTKSSFNYSSSANFAQTISRYPGTHHESRFTTTTTGGPNVASQPPVERYSEDEDDDDEDDEEEGLDEDIDDEEENGDSMFNLDSSRAPIIANFTSDLSTSTSRLTTTKSPSIVPNYYDPMEENKPRNDLMSTTSAPLPITTSPSSPTLPFSEYPSIIHPKTVAPMRTSSTTSIPRTTVPPTTTSMTSVAPIYSPTTMRPTPTPIRYATTQRDRVIPAISKTSDILTYDRGLKDDDVDLTKQIYDKAVEVYQAAYKAIHIAVETVWPPTFDLNSNTFEPLLAHSLLFMLALGGAVIALVLTMMLVVYIINYQIQPKEDDISIY